jgi:hypothetical protein
MPVLVNCEDCSKKIVDIDEIFRYGSNWWNRYENYVYTCSVDFHNIHTLKYKACPYHNSVKNKKLEGNPNMVKVELITEAGRVDLSKLPNRQTLVATKEEIVQDVLDNLNRVVKTGGLVITYKQADGLTFPQKYTKSMKNEFFKELMVFGVSDTTELQTRPFVYELRRLGRGTFPRYVPVAIATSEVETPKKGRK